MRVPVAWDSVRTRDESAEKIQIALGRRQGKGIDLEVGRLKSYVEIRAVEQASQAAKAAAQIKYESTRFILLQIGNQEVQQKGFSRTGAPEDHGVREIPMDGRLRK